MKFCAILVPVVVLCLTCCESNDTELTRTVDSYQYQSDSFYPLTIGNYWRIDDHNFTEIRNTILIDGITYYEVYTLIGGDASLTEYLRIDSEGNLLQGSPRNQSWNYVKAKFNSPAGDTFFTLGDLSYNDLKVTITSKNEDRVVFEYQMVYHPNLSSSKHTVEYKKGFGPVGNWKEARIDGVIYKYN